jgi:hypothetical protein
MRFTQRALAWLLSLMLAVLPVVSAQAAMIGTQQIVSPTVQADADKTRLNRFLEQQVAQQQLEAWGVSPAAVEARVNSLSDSVLARINQAIDNQHAGGTGVIGVLLVLFIVFVITDVLGATNIFPFIHPVR